MARRRRRSPRLYMNSARVPSESCSVRRSMEFLCTVPPAAAHPAASAIAADPADSTAAAAAAAAASSTGNGTSSASMIRAGAEGGRRSGSCSRVCEMAGTFISGLLTCVFAIAGLFVGAATGAVVGLATETGLLRGAGIGAMSGAVFSIDVVDSRGSGISSVLYVIEVVASLLTGRLVGEDVGAVVRNAVRRQMSAMNAPFREATDFFETGGTGGLDGAAVDEIPRIPITAENCADAAGERIRCTVCLQDLQPGETARRLPHCWHMFHQPCIDGWLIRHGSCPLCRRGL